MDEEIVFNPTGRRLCPDGSCVGLLDPAGRCSECGRSFGETNAPASTLGGDASAPARPAGDTSAATAPSTPAASAESGFDANRRLCDDGTCVGVVTANGTCNVCGRVARS